MQNLPACVAFATSLALAAGCSVLFPFEAVEDPGGDADADLDPALIGRWRFDEGQGSTAADDSSHDNDGTITGGAWTEGPRGGALQLDGVDDHVEVPDSPSLAFPDNRLTLAAWVRPTAATTNWVTIVQRSNAGGSWFDFQLYARAQDASGHPVFRVDWDGNGRIDAGDEVEADVALAGDEWAFVACTWDGAQLRIWIDGILRGATSRPEGVLPDGGRGFWIGANDIWGEPFEGLVDEVRLYGRALGEPAIRALAAQGTGS